MSFADRPFTTFILGAGASIPYGFPTWRALSEGLLSQQMAETFHEAGFADEDISAFREKYGLSGSTSIDDFLMYNDKFREIGSFGISRIIADSENLSDLMQNENVPSRWYGQLFSKLASRIPYPLNDCFGQDLSEEVAWNLFITFNYDRSIETFFWNRMVHGMGCGEQFANQMILGCRFVHPHGMIGRYGWESQGLDYGKTQRHSWLKGCHVTTIQIPKSPFYGRDVLDLIHQLPSRICFLGFGFHELNLQRLHLNAQGLATLRGRGVELTGTCLGMSSEQQRALKNRGFNLQNVDISTFINVHL